MQDSIKGGLIPDPEILLRIARTQITFGRYAGVYIIDLPENYLCWFLRQGFPPDHFGHMLKMVYEIKLNGLEYLFNPLREH
ncbi:MAG TPA: DUF3820 family protein [Burkholderiales bacterium]|nr:DUF3820 family protein [Pseudomonadota bacterium]HVC48782.1 DUF3820 family protein [Burkholderiales bacterium]